MTAVAVGDRVRITEGKHKGRTGQVITLRMIGPDFRGRSYQLVMLWIAALGRIENVLGFRVEPVEEGG